MAVNVKKYNPGFLTDQELAAAFCIRLHEFDSLLESLHLCTGGSNVHTIVIGPRGSGKTHLLLRVAAQVRQDAAWAGIFPIVFAEENYEVATCGEFWLECLNRLSDQAPASDRNALRLSYNEIQATPDDLTLQDRCLGTLLDFADRRGQRLLLIVERLHALFANMADPHAGWRLRHTLQTEPRIIWLGSATRRFAEIDSSQHALYDFFRVVTLHPLDTRACTRLWRTVSGREDAPRIIRSLEILTGGNPRWLTIMARCSAGRSFRELMGSVLDLVDEHTEYFKSHLEALSPQERRVYLALARIWKPATAREIAVQTRLSTNHCSALLKRLVQRGAVAIEEGNAYRQRYHLTERLYSLYYLLRRGGAAAEPVRALIDFMVGLYAPSKLSDTLASLSRDADVLSARIAERLREAAFDESLSLMQAGLAPKGYDLFGYAMHCLNAGLAPTPEAQAAAQRLTEALRHFARNQDRAGLALCDELTGRFGTRAEPQCGIAALALQAKAEALARQGDYPGALDACNQALARKPFREKPELDFCAAYLGYQQGALLGRCRRPAAALAAFDRIIKAHGRSAQPAAARIAMHAAIGKAVLPFPAQAAGETELAALLAGLDQAQTRPPIQLMGFVVAGIPADRALNLIQASPAAASLLPLTTALQQELGQKPRVAKETEEVAADVQRELATLRGWLRQSRGARPALDETWIEA